MVVEAGGTDGIRVTDDGIGMDRDASNRRREHTTSKIGDIEDLEAGVGTLGFRGEALHTIGAVSRLTIRSRPRGGDVGTDGASRAATSRQSPRRLSGGDDVAVDDLFYNARPPEVPQTRRPSSTTSTRSSPTTPSPTRTWPSR